MTPDTSELGFAFPPWLLWSAPVFMSERNQISRVWFKSAVFSSFRGVSEAGFTITVQLLFNQRRFAEIYVRWNDLVVCSSSIAAFHILAEMLVGTCSTEGPGSQWDRSRAEKGEGRGDGHDIPSWPVTSFQQGQEVRELGA